MHAPFKYVPGFALENVERRSLDLVPLRPKLRQERISGSSSSRLFPFLRRSRVIRLVVVSARGRGSSLLVFYQVSGSFPSISV